MGAQQRTVLVITYEFPPSGGGGVQRIAKFVRYLPVNGWRPVVVAATHVAGRPLDETLADEVSGIRVVRTPARRIDSAGGPLGWPRRARSRLRRPIRQEIEVSASEPARPASAGARGRRAARLVQTIASPDHAAFWVGPAVRAAVRLGRQEGADAVLATGPPFSALVAGARVARRLGVPFIADYRDAWRDNPGVWYPTRFHRDRAVRLERMVVTEAAAVVCAADFSAEVLALGGPEPVLLPNGFDPADMPVLSPDPAGPLRIVFMGTVYGVTDPQPVLEALALLREAGGPGSDARLVMVGAVPPTFLAAVGSLGLGGAVEMRGYLPHREALDVVAGTDVGLVVLKDGAHARAVRTGKIYEYLGMGLPVLLVGPTDGAAAELLSAARAGMAVGYETTAVTAAVRVLAESKAAGRRAAPPDPEVVGRFDRREQASVLAGVLDRAVSR